MLRAEGASLELVQGQNRPAASGWRETLWARAPFHPSERCGHGEERGEGGPGGSPMGGLCNAGEEEGGQSPQRGGVAGGPGSRRDA